MDTASGGHPGHSDPIVALSARDAVRRTAPGDRPRFVAALAFRLAELGHAKAVTVQVAGTAAA
jgi:hypothetical protein